MNHTHKYLHKNIATTKDKKYFVYQCTLPGCHHYTQEKLIFGKNSFCWICDKEFVIRPRGTRPFKRKPICNECWNKMYGKTTEMTEEKIEKLLKVAGAL
jgi:hypothetical protein